MTFTVPPGTTALLNGIGQANNATLYMTILAAFHVLLYHHTGDCDQIIGTMSSSRKHNATLHMLGLFLEHRGGKNSEILCLMKRLLRWWRELEKLP